MVLPKQEKIEKKPLKYTSVESEEIVNGKILVKVLANGVCHSDLHIVEGDFPLPASLFPLIPGHEILSITAGITIVFPLRTDDTARFPNSHYMILKYHWSFQDSRVKNV